jgi:hypothetical protein
MAALGIRILIAISCTIWRKIFKGRSQEGMGRADFLKISAPHRLKTTCWLISISARSILLASGGTQSARGLALPFSFKFRVGSSAKILITQKNEKSVSMPCPFYFLLDNMVRWKTSHTTVLLKPANFCSSSTRSHCGKYKKIKIYRCFLYCNSCLISVNK